MGYKVTAGISNKHVHVSREDFEVLFGKGKELTEMKKLSQPGQFACEEKVSIVGPNLTLEGVRILGPFRKQTQIELSVSDCFVAGIPAVLRDSGDLAGTPGCTLIGPAGSIELKEGVIVAKRHLHLNPEQAAEAGLKAGQIVSIRFDGVRSVVFNNVLVRSSDMDYLDFHLDIDESDAALLQNGQVGEVIAE